MVCAISEVLTSLVWKHFVTCGQRRHDALHVDDHHLHRAGHDGQFLLQEVAGDRQPVAHQHFVGGAADAGDVDAGRAL